MEKFFITLKKAVLLAAYAVVVACVFVFGIPRWNKMVNLKKDYEAQQRDHALRIQAINTYKHQMDRLKYDPDYVTKVFHENRRIRENELVIFIHESE